VKLCTFDWSSCTIDGPVSKFVQSQDNDGMTHAVSGIQTYSLKTLKTTASVDTAA